MPVGAANWSSHVTANVTHFDAHACAISINCRTGCGGGGNKRGCLFGGIVTGCGCLVEELEKFAVRVCVCCVGARNFFAIKYRARFCSASSSTGRMPVTIVQLHPIICLRACVCSFVRLYPVNLRVVFVLGYVLTFAVCLRVYGTTSTSLTPFALNGPQLFSPIIGRRI